MTKASLPLVLACGGQKYDRQDGAGRLCFDRLNLWIRAVSFWD